MAQAAGWQVPGWYAELKATAVPILGSRAGMASAARAAGLADVRVEERPVDVGVTEPEQLVRYRLGHPIFAGWLDAIGAARAGALAAAAEQAIRDDMPPYRPVVVFLSARAPHNSAGQNPALTPDPPAHGQRQITRPWRRSLPDSGRPQA